MPDPTLATLATALEACAQALRAIEPPQPAPAPAPPGPTVPTLLTVAQLCDKHPVFKPGTVYGWLAAREANGLAMAVIHQTDVGRLLIDEAAFFAWLETYREKAWQPAPAPVLHFPPARRRRAK
jgi:hypothetical protein